MPNFGSILKQGLRNAVPRYAGDRMQFLGELAKDYGPDIGMAALYSMTLPKEFASGPERFGVGLEDAALGIGGSMLGRLGMHVARGAMGRNSERAIGFANDVGGFGGGIVASMVGPRFYSDSLQHRAEEQQLLAQDEREKQLLQMGIRMGQDSPPEAGFGYAMSGFQNPYG
jgi:hypothetical protein